MPTLVAILSILAGIIFVSISSLGLITIIGRVKGFVANILAFAVIAYATIVLLAQVLSELNAIHWQGFLIGHAIIAPVVFPRLIKGCYPPTISFSNFLSSQKSHLKQWIASNPALTLLGVCVLGAMLLGIYLIIVVPPNIWDSLFVNLSRITYWLDNETLRHFQTENVKKTAFPINGEIGHLWLISLWGNDRLGGFIQWFATILTMAGIYGIARRLRFPQPASLFAALIWSTFTIVVLHSTSTKNDTLVAFFFVAAFYFLLVGLQDESQKDKVYFIFFGLAMGIAIGTKPVVLMFGPGLALMAGLLIYYKPRQFLPKFIYAALWSLLGLILLGSYNYVLNWFDYNSISGPDILAQEHLVQTLSIQSFVTNLGQISFHFIDPGGLPSPIVDFIQQWRPQVGQKIFSMFVPEALDTGFSFADTRQVTPREDAAWYGPLGFLLFWPVLFFYLVIAPFTRQGVSNFSDNGIWKWSVALISVSFLIIFAIFFRWNPWIGRMFIISVALGASLMAGFYVWSEKYKILRWTAITVAIVVLGWSSTHNFHKPVFGPRPIWGLDYYDLRTIQEPEMAAIYRNVDTNVPEEAKLGLAGEWPAMRWDYLFVGPNLRREYSYLGRVPKRITQSFFEEHNVDYIILASSMPDSIDSETSLWPIGSGWGLKWFLVKRSEAERFASQPCQSTVNPERFGAGYPAYRHIKRMLEHEAQPFRVLTTDPRMPCYEMDERFVFEALTSVADLKEFTHLVIPIWWSPEDYTRLGLPLQTVETFLVQEEVVEKVAEVNGFVLYRVL